MKTFYIGRFPPPYGGVTIKNRILYDSLIKNTAVEKIDLDLIRKKDIREALKLLVSLANPSSKFIIGSASTTRRFFSMFLYYFNRHALNNSLLIVMGGIGSHIIAEDDQYLKWVGEYKQVYVETESMKKELINKGINNISVFPNCREKPKYIVRTVEHDIKILKCLYFSLISKEKGADIVLEAAKELGKTSFNVSFDFYGHIDPYYKNEFKNEINKIKKGHYHGVFSALNDDLYKKLNEYDLLLFPTRWKAEGVPGVLVEAKIAGVPAIVSDINFNKEIVEDGKNGIVLKENTPKALMESLIFINSNKAILNDMKTNARLSAEFYYIDNYITDIVNMLMQSKK